MGFCLTAQRAVLPLFVALGDGLRLTLTGIYRLPGSRVKDASCPAVACKASEGIVDVEQSHMGRDMNRSNGGFELVLSGVIFCFAGLWLDRRLGTVPLFTVVLAVLGFGGAVANIYYRYKREIAAIEAETAALRKGGH